MKKITSIILSTLSLVCCGNPESCVLGNLDIYATRHPYTLHPEMMV